MAELRNIGKIDAEDDNSSSSCSILLSCSNDSSSSSSLLSSDSITPCIKLNLPENIAAYYDNRELIRDTEPVTCDDGLVEKVMLNYIIAKKILSNLCWQEKQLCKHVCTTWRSAINALAKEQINPVDFVYDLQRGRGVTKFKKSDNFSNEPLAVFIFANSDGFPLTNDCKDMSPCPCGTPCTKKSHCLIDAIHQQTAAPKNCMLTVIASFLAYMPLPQSICSAHTIQRFENSRLPMARPFIGGIYIPVIPGVEFHVLNIRQKNRNTIDMQTDFFDVIDSINLAQQRIIKGVLVYVTEKYILNSAENIVFLDYLKDVQPNVPYALGGCIVEETVFQQTDINCMIERFNTYHEFVSENLVSIGLFTIPKNMDPEKCNFEMYSLVIDSSEWDKPKIQLAINEFAKKVPNFEHSVALKLSCVGRDQKHALEQDYFRAAFPRTTLIGCYGNGELGINHPPRPPPEEPPRNVKRHRRNPRQQGIMYSYSTVFVYMGWGKITSSESTVN